MRNAVTHKLKIELPEPRRIKAKDVFLSYLLGHHVEEIILLLKNPLISSNNAIQISFMPLMQHHVEVAEALLSKPDRLLPVLCSAVVQAQRNLLQDLQVQLDKETLSEEKQAFFNTHGLSLDSLRTLSVKENVHPRLVGVPCPAETRVPRSADVGLLLCFSGTVVRATAPRLLRHTLLYTCDTCAHLMHVKADHDQYYSASKPQRCSNPNITCYSKSFSSAALPDAAHTADYQEVKLQELMSGGRGSGSSIPQSVWVTLHHDLVDSCKPGDDVLVCGSVVRRWKPISRDARPAIEVVIRANNITVRNKQEGSALIKPELEKEFEEFWKHHRNKPLVARDLILASVCPQMYGLYLVKLAVAVVLCGGVQRVDRGGTRVRGEPHLLLVGDPGTGKSQLLQWGCSAGSRAVLTTGVGSTAAGLTVAAVREPGGDWGLEAGALVLADGGVCCIDEFSSVREADRAAIHEAMEQQTISVAKAGMVCKLNSRCSIIAATNPKGRYDPTEPLNLNVGVASPLLSRFDLILVLLDTNNPNWDQLVSNYILSGGAGGRVLGEDTAVASEGCLWRLDKMRAYFRYSRRLQPRLSAAADAVLSRFYQMQRSNRGRDQSRTTIRLLESLVRLSQGHARLMLHREVRLMDAVVAVGLWEAAMTSPSGLHTIFEQQPHAVNAALHAGFPIDPTASYRQQAENLLRRLRLEEELQEELARLDEEDRQASAEHLAEILGANSSLGASAAVDEEPVSVSSRSGAQTLRVSTDPVLLRDVMAGTQARRPPTYMSCATQEARRRDLIEELEDVMPQVPEVIRTNCGRTSKKKSLKRKKKITGIDKYFKKNVIEHEKNDKTRMTRKKKKQAVVIWSESESNSSTSESDSDSSPENTVLSQSNHSHSTASECRTKGIECERTKSSESVAPPSKSKFDFSLEELVSVDDNQNVAQLSGSKSLAVSPMPNSGHSSGESLSENAHRPTIMNHQNDKELGSVASPKIALKSLSKKIVAKRKKSDESPFCVNISIKRARVSKRVGHQLKCQDKLECDAPVEIRGTLESSSDSKNPHQPKKNSKVKDNTSLEARTIVMDARKRNSNSLKENISTLDGRAAVFSDDSLGNEINITKENCAATTSTIVMDTVGENDRTTNSVECSDDRAASLAESGNDRATNSGEQGKTFSLSQKARSFLKQYAFCSEKNLRKNENSSLDSNAVASETVLEQTEQSTLESEPSDKLEQSLRFEKTCSSEACDIESSRISADSSANLSNSGALLDPVKITDESGVASITDSTSSFFCLNKPSPKALSSVASKLNRFAFIPKLLQDESCTNTERSVSSEDNRKNALQESSTPRNDPATKLKMEKETCVIISNRDNRIESSLKVPEIYFCSDTVTHNEKNIVHTSERIVQATCLEKEYLCEKLVNLESTDTFAGGRSLPKRRCFDLGAEVHSLKSDRKCESSVRKSFEKFASSQDLDDDFDF
ncbi:MCM OB domain [Trinorchestia longiramus]|nr:MCM OB domain [Trinorchestia longiramus]